MSNGITTGPFMVPKMINQSFSPTLLTICLKNPTFSRRQVRVIVEQSPQINPVNFGSESYSVSNEVPETILCNERVTVSPHHSRCVYVHFTPSANGFLRVSIQGDVDDDSKGIEVCVIGSNENLDYFEPTMYFRHSDFIEIDGVP